MNSLPKNSAGKVLNQALKNAGDCGSWHIGPKEYFAQYMRAMRHQLVFVLLCLLFTAALWRSIVATFGLALRDSEFSYILLILPVSLCLAWLEWKPSETATWNLTAGSSLAVIGLLLAACARILLPASPDAHRSLAMLAWVTWWNAAFVLCFGLAAARTLLFPLCFLFWMVPLPESVVKKAAQFLQAGSATSAALLFSAVGIPSSREEVFVSIPGLNLEVARECSSLRSSVILVVTTMVLAQLLLRSPWRRTLLIVLALPLAIAKNGLRIFAIGMLTTRVDRSFLTGWLHHDGGIVFFLVALAVVFAILWVLRKSESTSICLPSLSPTKI